jgi:glucosamine--fructose-6-phosphate aminotransferase (isomerizing)
MLTKMAEETHQIPDVVSTQFVHNAPLWEKLAKEIQTCDIRFVMTVARGSSDHAATFAKYLFEVYLGLPVVSAAPSINTIYHSKLKLKNSLVIGVSQSGQSPDICEVLQQAKDQGALTVALVNQADSRMANIADYLIPLCAGPELAVAATKSYVASLSALVQGVAICAQDQALLNALTHLPGRMAQALDVNWDAALSALRHTNDIFTIGRGFGFPIAQEAGLKFKETCRLHAEPFSSAEVMHGPFALIQKAFPVLQFVQDDATLPGSLALVDKMSQLGSNVLLAMPEGLATVPAGVHTLPLPQTLHGTLDPLVAIVAFYGMVEKLALLRGFNPDKPENLKKVTETR